MKKIKIIIPTLLFFISNFTFAQSVDWQYFKMNGNECQIFTTSGNSRIIVPSHCFLQDGKPYNGPVLLAFKEYKDQADFILGGLNLRYEVNGKLNTLQSGGMFEFYATTNNEQKSELTFANPKKVVIKFAIDPKFDVAGLEPYFYDPKTKNWVKNTRYGKTFNDNISDKASDLWQDEVVLPPSNRDPEMDGDGVECYTIQIIDRNDPSKTFDSLICPQIYNPLDSRYSNYMSKEAYKTMQIENMGLFNYDKIFDDENNVPLFVKLKTKDGKTFELTDKLYVVYKTTNSVIYYNKDELANKFSLLPRSDIKIFVFNADGTISKVPDSFWKDFDPRKFRGKTLELPLETLKLARFTKEEFARYTGL